MSRLACQLFEGDIGGEPVRGHLSKRTPATVEQVSVRPLAIRAAGKPCPQSRRLKRGLVECGPRANTRALLGRCARRRPAVSSADTPAYSNSAILHQRMSSPSVYPVASVSARREIGTSGAAFRPFSRECQVWGSRSGGRLRSRATVGKKQSA